MAVPLLSKNIVKKRVKKFKRPQSDRKICVKSLTPSSSTKISAPKNGGDNGDFLPLEGGPARKLPKGGENLENKSTVLYIGRLPHGFYEDELEGFFKQFGTVKRVKVARNRKTGKSKHYGFIEFEYPEVASIAAEAMDKYLLFNHLLQVQQVPPERVHHNLWRGIDCRFKPRVDFVRIARKKHNKDRTLEGQSKLLRTILKQDRKRRNRIEAAGIDYECPKIKQMPGISVPISSVNQQLLWVYISTSQELGVEDVHSWVQCRFVGLTNRRVLTSQLQRKSGLIEASRFASFWFSAFTEGQELADWRLRIKQVLDFGLSQLGII